MHPIEHLRFVARSSGADQRVVVHEAATALRALAADPAGLLVSCRRLIERHPTSGAVWWFASTVLAAGDPRAACRAAALEVTDDPTPQVLVDHLPEGATVCVVGWPDLVGDAVLSRGDLTVLAVDGDDQGAAFARRLARSDVAAEVVPAGGLAAAAVAADVVLVEASAASPDDLLATAGSRAVASVAYCAEVPVWAVVGRCRVVPESALSWMVAHAIDPDAPWDAAAETVPIGLVTHLVGPSGVHPSGSAALTAECVALPELLR